MPFKAKRNLSSLKTSNLLMFSGIKYSKFLMSAKKLNTSSGDLLTLIFGDSKFIILLSCYLLSRLVVGLNDFTTKQQTFYIN